MLKNIFFLLLTVTITLSACGTLEVKMGQEPAPTIDAGQVATIVAATMAAFPSSTPASNPTVEPTATTMPVPASLLSGSLYYLAPDSNSQSQIYRLGRDGSTTTQITFEPRGVDIFDVSLPDDVIVYSTSREIISVNFNGKDPHILIQDSTADLFRPVLSPNGQSMAYGDHGNIYLYSFATQNSSLLLAGNDNEGLGPKLFSPDGSKLIIQVSSKSPHAPGSDIIKIYDFPSKTLTSISFPPREMYPCYGDISWVTPDAFFCFFDRTYLIPLRPGLWRIDANHGYVTALLASKEPPFPLVGAPRLDSDGNLYYLYGEDDGVRKYGKSDPTLSLVRSDADGTTNRVALRPEAIRGGAATWTPDASGIVIVQNDEKGQPLSLVLMPVDPSQPIVTLLADASRLKNTLRWGP